MNEATTSTEAGWMVPLVVLGLLAFWPLLCLLIARFGGWARIARAFAARREPEGARFRGLSLQIEPVTSYSRCICAIFSRDGLWLAPIWLFRPGHAPLLIPWDHVGAPVEHRVFGFRQSHLPIKAGRRTLRLSLSRKLERWLPGADDRGGWRPTLAGDGSRRPAT